MNNLIELRKKVYDNFPKENLNSSSTDIVLFYDINNDDYSALTQATQNFLCKSLSLVHDREFVWTNTFLEDNDKLIMELPNKTPNGIVNPKNETLCQSLEGISVSISSYSSSIVDGFIYDIVPLVFNTSKLLKTYNPYINKLELGIETKNFFYAQNKFGKVLENVNKIKLFKKNIKEKKFFFIKYIGNRAEKKLLKTILK